jgi:hypothetical protein
MDALKKVCNCRVCERLSIELFQGALLDQNVTYYECKNCGYVQTEHPYWLDRAYLNAINVSDTGIMARNLSNSRVTLATLACLGKLRGSIVDYAGGYGILVRLLRDYGVDALWFDQYCQNILAKGFEYQPGTSVELVTAFEVFEHFVDPVVEIETLFAIAPNVLLSTQIISNPAPDLGKWWYYGNHHGQHIGFFRVKTLEFLAGKYNKHISTDGHTYHLFSEKKPVSKLWSLFINRHINRLPTLYAMMRLQSKIWSDNKKLSEDLQARN